MRLICPNCGAQYEVAEDVIPAEGRDVQCSSCGHTWLERPGASSIEDAFADVMEPEAQENSANEVHDDTTWIEEENPVTAPKPPVSPASPERQELDPAIADILREEAAREAAARELEAQAAIETQEDLDLSQDLTPGPEPIVDAKEAEAQRRMATLKGEEVTTAQAASAAATRRELLPDIEEINSSLRSESERDSDVDADTTTDAEKPKKSSGFRRGFFAVIVALLIALLIYLFADQISAAIPQLEPALDSYVTQIDALRLWVDERLKGILAAIDTKSESDQN